MIRAAGGRFLVRGIPAEVFEAGQKLRTVVIEFESVPATTATYNDPVYQECVKLLRDAVVRDIRIVGAPVKCARAETRPYRTSRSA